MTELAKIFEKRILTNIRLTQHQMKVLAMIAASPEGIVPDEDISKDRNMTAARQLLTKLGLITNDGEDKYSITDSGAEVAKDENIIDDTGQLTELGNQLAFGEDDSTTPEQTPPEPTPAGPQDEPADAPFAQTSTEVGLPGPSESVVKKGALLLELMESETKTFLKYENTETGSIKTFVAKTPKEVAKIKKNQDKKWKLIDEYDD